MKYFFTFIFLLFTAISESLIAREENDAGTSLQGIMIPEKIAIGVWEEDHGKLVDITSTVIQAKLLTLRTNHRYFELRIGEIPDSIQYFYRFEGYDVAWLPFQNGPIRAGMIPEGHYNLQVATIHHDEPTLLCNIPVQIKGGLFYGVRGYLIVFTVLGLTLVIFLWIRSIILRRDRNRTVRYLENTVMRRTNQLQELVNQRELLLKEIHHRVKNNLQVISALLEMQGSRTTDENVKAAITEGQNRVLSIAFIHQNLYQHDDLKGVEIGTFLKELISHIRQVFEKPDCPVTVTNLVPTTYIDIDSAIPLGLIINELLTNSYKYAFKGRNEGNIVVELTDLGAGTFHFKFSDNGVGLPENFDFTKSNSLGMKLVRQLSRQLAGNIQYHFEGGSNFEMTFRNLEARSKML